MNAFEIIAISIGISLDFFAVMTCRGAMMYRIKKLTMIFVGVLFGGWQALVLLIGNSVVNKDVFILASRDFKMIVAVLAVIIFIGLGVYMIAKGLKHKTVYEKREEKLNVKHLIAIALINSIIAFLAGIGLALINTDITHLTIPIIAVNIISVVSGIYTGYHLGYEQMSKAYSIGGIILLIIGTKVLFSFVL